MIITNLTGAETFAITDTKLYALVLTLSNKDTAKLFEQLKLSFKKIINWNKYQSKMSIERQNQYLDYLVDLIFQRVNSLFVLSFEDNVVRTGYTRYFHPAVEIQDYNVMIDGKNFLINQ